MLEFVRKYPLVPIAAVATLVTISPVGTWLFGSDAYAFGGLIVTVLVVIWMAVVGLRLRHLRRKIEAMRRDAAYRKPFPALPDEHRPALEQAIARVDADPMAVDAFIADLVAIPEPHYTQIAGALRFRAARAQGMGLKDAAHFAGTSDVERMLEKYPDLDRKAS